MTTAAAPLTRLPDHKQLPETDGSIVENSQEHPQGNLLVDTLAPRLAETFGPDGCFVGLDTGIYWAVTEPPLAGCKSPDWYVVPGVPPMLDGEARRSYVLWHEVIHPLIVAEFVSGTGSDERDRTPRTGKFWVYEKAICASYYAIFDGFRSTLEVWRLVDGIYQRMEPNADGRYLISPLGIELGIWEGAYRGIQGSWLRPWDTATGTMLPLSEERAEQAEANIDHFQELAEEAVEQAAAERRRAEAAERRAEEERLLAAERVRLLEEKLRAAGIDPAA